jgi:hypothetical protein
MVMFLETMDNLFGMKPLEKDDRTLHGCMNR